jgi:hypothetical protein
MFFPLTGKKFFPPKIKFRQKRPRLHPLFFLFFLICASGEALPFLLRDAEAFASFSVFVLRTKAFAPSPRHFDRSAR